MPTHTEQLNLIRAAKRSASQTSTLPPLYGLVLSGGGSRRMKRDKSLLQYHGKRQLAHAFELLSTQCEQVFISHRKEQAQLYDEFPQIHDLYEGLGPVGGILSAMAAFPGVSWFVLANDLPYVDAAAIHTLIQHRHPEKFAVVYHNSQTNFPEPLCTIYEPAMQARLWEFLNAGGQIFRKVLEDTPIQLLSPPHDLTLSNVNYPEEYERAVKRLSNFG